MKFLRRDDPSTIRDDTVPTFDADVVPTHGVGEVIPTYDAGHLPQVAGAWPKFRKTVPIMAVKMPGPFAVRIEGQGPESVITCSDGYLALDARGYPYPVATDEFNLIYEPFGEV